MTLLEAIILLAKNPAMTAVGLMRKDGSTTELIASDIESDKWGFGARGLGCRGAVGETGINIQKEESPNE